MLIGVRKWLVMGTSRWVQRMSATSDGFRVDINIAEDFILGIHVMAVTRCNNRLAREFRGLDDIVQHF